MHLGILHVVRNLNAKTKLTKHHEIEISKYLYMNSQLTIIKAIYIASEPFSNKNCEKVIKM